MAEQSITTPITAICHGEKLTVIVSPDNYITFQNDETDATNFWFTLGVYDWEKIKDFVEKNLP